MALFKSVILPHFCSFLRCVAPAFKEEFLVDLDFQEPFKIPKSFPEDPDQDYHIPMIEMSEELAKSLNYESKLDRFPESIHRLIADGEKQGKQFLETRLNQMNLR